MNWHKNFLIQPGQVFVVWTDGWRTGPGVLGLSPPLIGQGGDNGGLWLAYKDNKGDRVNETDGQGTCARLLVRFAGWLNAWDGRIFVWFSKNVFCCFWLLMHENLFRMRFIDFWNIGEWEWKVRELVLCVFLFIPIIMLSMQSNDEWWTLPRTINQTK